MYIHAYICNTFICIYIYVYIWITCARFAEHKFSIISSLLNLQYQHDYGADFWEFLLSWELLHVWGLQVEILKRVLAPVFTMWNDYEADFREFLLGWGAVECSRRQYWSARAPNGWCIFAYICIYIYIHTCVHTHTIVYTFACTRAIACTRIIKVLQRHMAGACIYMYVYIYTCTYIHNIYIYIYMYAHSFNRMHMCMDTSYRKRAKVTLKLSSA